jgi:hypothetical protein
MSRQNSFFLLALFGIAFSVRCFLILATPKMNQQIDLSIYIDGGQLMSRGVNPYLYTEGVEIREKLRTDATAYHEFTCATQARWDYYASSNLPLSLLFYGGIDLLSSGNAFVYRLAFAFFDAFLACLIAYFLLLAFGKKAFSETGLSEKGLIMGLGALSPTLLLWGVLIPEEKGVQILLMLGALLAARFDRWVVSAVLLGGSVAFKGLGVFIAPLCLWYVTGAYADKDFTRPFLISKVLSYLFSRRSGVYIGLSVGVTLACFAPFLPEVLTMMTTRLDSNLNSTEPTHGSIWRFAYWLMGDSCFFLKQGFILFFIGLHSWFFYKKGFSLEILTAGLLMLFVDISLQNGSLDRMNIGFVVGAMLVALSDLKNKNGLLWYAVVVGGLTSVAAAWAKSKQAMDFELFDAAFALGFVGVYVFILLTDFFDGHLQSENLKLKN